MRVFTLILFLITSAACFVGGYILGQLNPKSDPTGAVAAPKLTVDLSAETKPQPIEASAPLSVADSLAPTSQLPSPIVNEDDSFAQRALQTVQTFSDKTGRQLIAEIVEVKADSLEVRRQSDHRILQLPFDILSAKDKAFAAFLWEQQNLNESTPESSMEEQIWDQLFQ